MRPGSWPRTRRSPSPAWRTRRAVADLVRTLDLTGRDRTERLGRRWLVTNGLGGFASGLLSGILRSRYHGLLVAALGAPLGRVVMFTHLREQVQRGDGPAHAIGGGDPREPEAAEAAGLVEFRLENGLPVWRYALEDSQIEKRVLLPQTQNTVHVQYRLLACSGPLRLTLQPSLHFRPLEARVSEPLREDYVLSIMGSRFEVAGSPDLPPLRLRLLGDRLRFTAAVDTVWEVFYLAEAERGYDSRGALWTPGSFSLDLGPGCDAALVAS